MCHKEGMVQPVIVKILEIEKNNISDTKLYKKEIEKKLFEINKSIISNELPKDVSVWAVKTLVSLLCMMDYKKIFAGLELADDDLDKKIILKSMTMIPGVNKKECIISSITDSVISLLISGVFSNHQMPSDKMLEAITNTIKVPTQEKIIELNRLFEKFYKKNPRNKAIDIVAALVSDEYAAGYNIESLAGDFMLYEDRAFVTEVKAKLQ